MKSAGKGPQRTCVACRQAAAQDQLLRYVVAPDGSIVIDYRQRLPGRGAYTCVSLDCLRAAVERKQFQRSFRGRCNQVELAVLVDELGSALEQKIVSLLGMGRKSGQVVSGSNAVMTALRHGNDVALVVMTTDISASIAEKIKVLAQHQNVVYEQMLSKDLLGQILGKGERSVVAVHKGTLADALLSELQRYKQLVREN